MIQNLSPIKQDICKYLVQGYKNKEIAEKIHISIHTVKAYVGAIIEDNNLNSRTQLAYILGIQKFDTNID